jgi:tRNA G37 N-methylase TrmD
MRQYPILSAAWDECSMIWKGVEQDGTIHKFNRKAMRKIVKDEQAKVDDRLIGGNDHMINPVGKPGSNERLLALALQYATLTEQEQSPFGE